MPCYDGRDNERTVYVDKPFDHHNNPTAELLCGLLTKLEKNYYDQEGMDALLGKGSKIWHWWSDHKERDRKKASREKAERDAEVKRLEARLAKLKGSK